MTRAKSEEATDLELVNIDKCFLDLEVGQPVGLNVKHFQLVVALHIDVVDF